MRLRMLEATAAAAVVFMGTGCDGGGISRQEFYDRAEELQADMFAGGGGEAVRDHRELLARAPDGPLRDSAGAAVREIESLFDEVIVVRTELLERAEREPEPEEERPGSIARLFRRDPVRGRNWRSSKPNREGRGGGRRSGQDWKGRRWRRWSGGWSERRASRLNSTAGWRRTGRRWRGCAKRAKPGGRRNRNGPGRSRSRRKNRRRQPSRQPPGKVRSRRNGRSRPRKWPRKGKWRRRPPAAEPEPAPREEPPALEADAAAEPEWRVRNARRSAARARDEA